MKVLFSLLFCLTFTSIASVANEQHQTPTLKLKLHAADGHPPYGVFDVTAPDGQVYREVISPDGTFSSTAKDGSSVEGVWEQRENGIFCSKPHGAPVFRCKYEKVNSDGIWTSTEIDGSGVSTIIRVKD